MGGTVAYADARTRSAGADLRSRYEAYRRRQARALLHMLPQDAIRPLYRRASSAGQSDASSDPMEAMVRYCETLLPLPPFDVWCEDVRDNPTAHLHDVDRSAEAPGAESPVTLESRDFAHLGRTWSAHLRSFRDGVAWRGFIAFEDRGANRVHRTALIFRESDAVEVRERFLSFEIAALIAFLRSALP